MEAPTCSHTPAHARGFSGGIGTSTCSVENKVKSVSKVRTPHMGTIDTLIVDDKYKMYNTPQKRMCTFCCKETNDQHLSLDIWSSKPIRA